MEEANIHKSEINLLRQPSNTPCEASISSANSLDKRSDKSFPVSTFADFECGGPQKPQHLVFDFTPTDTELDAPEVRKKVSDFWNFLWAQKDIEHYCVMPDSSQDIPVTGNQTPTLDDTSSSSQTSVSDRFANAINALAEIGVFGETETPQEGLENCFGNLDIGKKDHRETFKGDLAESSKSPKHTISSSYKIGISQDKNAEVRAMCKELEAWDEKHPKPMGPPAHVGHHQAVLQRTIKPYQDMNIKTCECEDI